MSEAMIHGDRPVELLTQFIMLRVSPTQLGEIRAQALGEGRTVANYIRRVLALDYRKKGENKQVRRK